MCCFTTSSQDLRSTTCSLPDISFEKASCILCSLRVSSGSFPAASIACQSGLGGGAGVPARGLEDRGARLISRRERPPETLNSIEQKSHQSGRSKEPGEETPGTLPGAVTMSPAGCHSSDTNSPCCDTTDAACPGNASSLDPTDPLYREEPESPIWRGRPGSWAVLARVDRARGARGPLALRRG